MSESSPEVKPPARSYESITRWAIGGWTIRVWRTEKSPIITDADLADFVKKSIKELVVDGREFSSAAVLLEEFATFPDVSAVEITGSDGSGVLVYINWPQ